ncbi:hypothetical protein RDABS01_009949 [Bienertia sinuspersici]
MVDSGTKHPENRIHLYDPVGLLNDGYGSFRPSSHTVRPRRQTVSCDNFVETIKNSDTTLELTSYDSFNDHANSTGGLRSYDSFEVDSLSLRSLNESFVSQGNGSRTSSHDTTTTTTTTNTAMIDQERNDGGLRFVVVDTVDEDESDSSTPRLWGHSAPTSPPSLCSPQQQSTSPESVNSSLLHPTSPKSVNSSLSLPTSPKSVNSCPLHPTSPKSVKFSPLNPNNSTNISPSQTSPTHPHFQAMSPNSRTQAIAKGRKELMDMVRDLPESFYELSLRDIVEQKPELELKKEIDIPEEKKPIKESTMANETKKQKKSNSKKVKKSESKKKMVRSRSVDNGKFLLKTSVFPILGSRKSKKSMTVSNSFKVAPMPKAETTSSGHTKVGEKDWWRRKTCIASESDGSNGLSSQSTSSRSSTSSSRSNSSNGRYILKAL